jgi:hypothetical protein
MKNTIEKIYKKREKKRKKRSHKTGPPSQTFAIIKAYDLYTPPVCMA